MSRNIMISAVLATCLCLATQGATGANKPELKARISPQQAETLALRTCPGKILKRELEREKGGSGLRYSFDIQTGKVIREVGIDAVTGMLLENSADNGKD